MHEPETRLSRGRDTPGGAALRSTWTGRPVVVLALALVLVATWAVGAQLLIALGLLAACVNAVRLLSPRSGPHRVWTEADGVGSGGTATQQAWSSSVRVIALSLALVWTGFFLGQGGNLWIVGVAPLVAAVVIFSMRLLRRWHVDHRGTGTVPFAIAVVLTTSVLVELGLLLAVRLVVVPDPDPARGEVFHPDAWGGFWKSVLLPLGLVLAVLTFIRAGQRWPGLVRWLPSRPTRLPTRAVVVAGLGAVAALFALPLLGSANGLEFLGLATPEFGKILYVAVLTGLLVRYSVDAERHRYRPPRLRELPRSVVVRRDVGLPVLLFVAAAVPSGWRSDFGPLVPLFLATACVILLVLWTESGPGAGESPIERLLARIRSTRQVMWPYLVPLSGLVLVGAIVAVTTGYIGERFSVAGDPWRYSWAPACVDPLPTAEPPTDVPEGTAACQESLLGHVESRRSQLAEGLALIADGGVWGRGIGDATSGGLPADETDFVLAVIWSKLGGLVVFLVTAVVVLLGTALVRTARASAHPRGGFISAAQVLAVAMAALLVGQFAFVLAATLDWVPHSGITVPFLSYGPQSTIALLVGVVAAVVVACRSARATTVAPFWSEPAPQRGTPFVPTGIVLAICFGMILHTVLLPYGGHAEDRPACPPGATGIDPAVCSTDGIALARTSIRIEFAAGGGYTFDRGTQRWIPLTSATPPVTSMAGLLGTGAEAGVLDLAYEELLNDTAGTSLGRRLLPARFQDNAAVASLTLTVDPALQSAAATTLTEPGPEDAGPLAGGAVVLDAETGHVLAAASAPTALPPPAREDERSLISLRQDYAESHGFGVRAADGSIAEGGGCSLVEPTAAQLEQCWRWSLTEAVSEADPRNRTHLLDYVGGDQAVEPPATDENRALGRRYGLGSTFKVVIAAAYLSQEGTSANDRIPAPPRTAIGGQVIQNSGGGTCAGARDGTITLTQALAVSCNTAFVLLAHELGWPLVRDTAAELGFEVGGVDNESPAVLSGEPLGTSSLVPAEAVGAELANAALGGGAVSGTPLQMAAVMAMVANGGRAITPSLVLTTTSPRTGQAEPVASPDNDRQPVLTEGAAYELASALSRTASEGTAEGLTVPDGRTAYVKTGTHELYADGAAPSGTYPRYTSWLVGFVDTAQGPVAFACAVEARSETEGTGRVRQVTERLIHQIIEERG